MDLKDINTNKIPVVVIDKTLDFLNDKVLFPEKVEKANEMLKKVGLPQTGKRKENTPSDNGFKGFLIRRKLSHDQFKCFFAFAPLQYQQVSARVKMS